MTPKEKANELVQRFSKLYKGLDEEEWIDREVSFEEIHKQSALICVDEMINCNTIYMKGWYIEYWEVVRLEINNL